MSQLAQLQSDFQAYLMDDVKGAAFKAHIINDKKVGVSALAFIMMVIVCVLLKRWRTPTQY